MVKEVLMYAAYIYENHYKVSVYKGYCPACGKDELFSYAHPDTSDYSMSCQVVDGKQGCGESWWFINERAEDKSNYKFLVFDKLTDLMTYKVQVKLLEYLDKEEKE